MATKRTYHDACGAAKALDLVGERWTLLIVRELILGPKRFTAIRAGLSTISPNVLTQRLNELEEISVVQRRKLPPPASAWVYELTEWGHKLDVVIMELGRWAAQAPSFDAGGVLGADSLLMSFRTMFQPEAADGLTASYELRLGDDRFTVEIANGRIGVSRDSAAHPDAVFTSTPPVIAGIVYTGDPMDQAIAAGELTIHGDRNAADRFIGLFALPEPVSS